MGISELRQIDAHVDAPQGRLGLVERALIDAGALTHTDAILARVTQRYCDAPIERILSAEGLCPEGTVLSARAQTLDAPLLNASDLEGLEYWPGDASPALLIKHAVLPFRGPNAQPSVVLADVDDFERARPMLPKAFAHASLHIAPRRAIQTVIAKRARAHLVQAASARVPARESCRNWGEGARKRIALALTALAALCMLTLAFPTLVFSAFVIWAAFTLFVSAGLRAAAFVSCVAFRTQDALQSPTPKPPLPKVSILVPLFKETEIAHALVARLSQLTYPKCLLDVILMLEEEDQTTRETLAGIDLPNWVRAVVVPDGQPRTKPRAMNYALEFCEGDVIGIFDAEDAPDPDQISRVARRFQSAPDDVACLQGVLDYYNPRQNWLARCFTIEYATWFRVMLPGMAKLGFAIPLGGTTLYFRRDILERLGGWDAHNVTEDADLGFRLARHGYRTEMIDTVTEEEANCRPWAWVKQRSRWLKGYMTTYLVHMRRPMLLYRQLGGWKFWGFQAHFITALSQFVLAPFLWSFWLVLLGLSHPLDPFISRNALAAFGGLFLAIEVLNIAIYATAVSGAKHRHLIAWAPTMHFYLPLGAIAAYKALYELIFKPFFWSKTTHGLSLGHVAPAPSNSAFDLARVKFQAGYERL